MAKTVIFGAQGFLGSKFAGVYPEAITPAVDISDANEVFDCLSLIKPDVVINAAGATGRPNIDSCEFDRLGTLKSNVMGPLVLVETCQKMGIYLAHVGSGCIYDGDQGFKEEDAPNFTGSWYSKTKAWSDRILNEFPVLNLRLRMPFDGSDHPRNLITKLRGYKKVLDAANSMTYVPDFFNVAEVLIERRATGTWNVVNPGVLSPFYIMERYRELVDPAHRFEKLFPMELSSVAGTGRSNCRLSSDKVRKAGIPMMDAEDALNLSLIAMKERRLVAA